MTGSRRKGPIKPLFELTEVEITSFIGVFQCQVVHRKHCPLLPLAGNVQKTRSAFVFMQNAGSSEA